MGGMVVGSEQHGKETEMIVGLSGRKGSGKSTVGAFLVQHMPGAREITFARELKELTVRLFGARPEQAWGTNEQKNERLSCGRSAREVMQRLGHGLREIDENVWVRAWRTSVLGFWQVAGPGPVVVTDVRYPNEMAAIRELGGVVIRLTRVPYPEDVHASETALDAAKFDAVLDNTRLDAEATCVQALELAYRFGVM